MIQRIQSLWLLIATILISLWLFFPLAIYTDTNTTIFLLLYNGVKIQQAGIFMPNLPETTYIMVSIITSIIWYIITIFSYTDLKRQQWMCILSIVLMVINLLAFAYYHLTFSPNLGSKSIQISWLIIIPLINIVLSWLARKAIRKDDDLIKSVDHIR